MQTQLLIASLLSSLLLYSYTARASEHIVLVGDGGNVFNPSHITASIGDTVIFVFIAGVNIKQTSSTDFD